MLPAEMRKVFSTLALTKPKQNAEAMLHPYEAFGVLCITALIL